MRREIQRVFAPLLEPARYKGAHGGRGSGKSHFMAENLVEDHLALPGLRSVCLREVQKDLKHSAKQLIEDKLNKFSLGTHDGFRVYDDRIQCPGDGVMLFRGMQDYNAESIKSLEGFHRAWFEEAQTASATSLRMLRPTIREKDSELLFSWNPRRKSDPVDVMLRQGTPPTGSVVVQANFSDNPWFPPVLEQERLDCLRDNPEEYPHIWEGDYFTVLKGAYYAGKLLDAEKEGRVGFVPHDPHLRFRVFCDLGGAGAKSDAFAMWVAQFVGLEIRVLNYYEAQGQEFGEHLHWLESKGYTQDRTSIWLPHDGRTSDRLLNVSFESAFKGAGYTKTTVIDNQGTGAASMRVEEARKLFPAMRFNKETTEAGREALGWYHEKLDEKRQVGLGPEHDWASHGADAFGLMAIAYEPPTPPKPQMRIRTPGRKDRDIGY